MAYDEERQRRSRVVIETPGGRREEVRTVTAHVPERRGVPGAVVAALVIGSVALVTLLFLFILNRQSSEEPVATTSQTTTTASQPAAQQPVIVQQQPSPQPIIIQPPPSTTSQAPVIIEQPVPASAPPVTGAAPRPNVPDDSTIQSEIDKRMAEDATLSTTAVTATVIDGKVTLIGTVDAQALKDKVERLVKAIKGVKSVDNQVIVSGG